MYSGSLLQYLDKLVIKLAALIVLHKNAAECNLLLKLGQNTFRCLLVFGPNALVPTTEDAGAC